MTNWMKGYKPIAVELKLDEYTLYGSTTYIRKDAWAGRTLGEMYELGIGEPLKPNWVNKRWNDGRGEKKDGGWGFSATVNGKGNDYIVKWV
jgi:hypothetical protein